MSQGKHVVPHCKWQFVEFMIKTFNCHLRSTVHSETVRNTSLKSSDLIFRWRLSQVPNRRFKELCSCDSEPVTTDLDHRFGYWLWSPLVTHRFTLCGESSGYVNWVIWCWLGGNASCRRPKGETTIQIALRPNCWCSRARNPHLWGFP